jgi:hypothetical protein
LGKYCSSCMWFYVPTKLSSTLNCWHGVKWDLKMLLTCSTRFLLCTVWKFSRISWKWSLENMLQQQGRCSDVVVFQ